MSQVNIYPIRHLKGHMGSIYTLAHDCEEACILSAGSDGFICRWMPLQHDLGHAIAQTGERIFCLHMFNDSKQLFAGTMNGALIQIAFQEQIIVRKFQFHDSSIYRLGFWNEHLLSVAGDGILALWNPADASILNNMKICPSKLRSLAVDSQNHRVFTGDAQGNIWIVDLPDLKLVDCIAAVHDKTVFSLNFLSKNGYLLSGGMDARLKVILNNQVKEEIKAHWFSINDICELTGTRFVATASRDKSIRLWSQDDLRLVKEISYPKFAAHLHSVNCLLWNQKQQVLYSAGDDGIVIAWKLEINYDT